MPSQSVLATLPFTVPNIRFDPPITSTSGLTVQFAFTPWAYPPRDPVGGDWVDAAWVSNTDGTFDATLEVGPDGHALAAGKWAAWWRVLGATSHPVVKAGVLIITSSQDGVVIPAGVSPVLSVNGTLPDVTGNVDTAGGGTAGVETFNTRSGSVILSKADVTGTGLAAADVGAATSAALTSEAAGRTSADTANANALTTHKTSTDHDSHNDGRYVKRAGDAAIVPFTLTRDPTDSAEPATKGYTDALAQGYLPKPPAAAVATVNTARSGLLTFDGYTLVDGDRVLLSAQSSALQNGLWLAHSGAWTRPTDFAVGAYEQSGTSVVIRNGTQFAASTWVLYNAAGPVLVDTDGQTWIDAFSVGQIINGTGLTKSGNTLAVDFGTTTGKVAQGDDSRITGAARALTPTAVKTANYTAAANEYVAVDTTSGAVTVTLPNAPADKTRLLVKHVIQGGTNAVTVACAGSDVFNKAAGATTASLSLLAQAIMLQYEASTHIWTVQADDIPLAQLDLRFPQRANNLSDVASAGTSRANLSVPMLAPALVASTANVASLSGLPTTDGVTLTDGQVVLATAQTTGSQNGPWAVHSGAWTRPADYAAGATAQGHAIQVLAGTVNAGTMWVLMTSTAVTVDTTATSWQLVNKVSGSILAQVTSNAGQAGVTSTTAIDLSPSIVTNTFVADGSQVSIHWGMPAASNGTANNGVALYIVRNYAIGGDNGIVDYIEGWSATSNARIPLGGMASLDTPTAGVSTSYKMQVNVLVGGTVTLRNTSSIGQVKIFVRHA